ncbi:MAG: 4Fe-4S dicluster domain-containing protein, partial [Actinobacteria bacterium]|nr:4Fe-4S dicluster domain-containing protein [Actinomycetota bacterium]
DLALDSLHEVELPGTLSPASENGHVQPGESDLLRALLAGEGDRLPVSALPADGTFPLGTARFEKRDLADELPIWDEAICIDCAKCALVCPHAAIRMKVYEPAALAGAPTGFRSKDWRAKDLPGMAMTIQVSPDDCTGCRICVETCPAKDKAHPEHKSLDSLPKPDHLERERENWEFFLTLPELDRTKVQPATVKGSQMLQPLFEFSGACSGCGETPYLKLLTQLFGDRLLVANATGCSSIYGGNLPTTPWTTNAEGRGPAWANSLFEDNAEFGYGMRLALDQQEAQARRLLAELNGSVPAELKQALLEADQSDEAGVIAQRERVVELRNVLAGLDDPRAQRLATLADALEKKSVWIVGGDGWAYDIGFGGLDHVLASGRNVNVLVLDTEVYSNTGGQASKSTPRGAVAKFAAGGKHTAKKDLGLMAAAYGNVYVAQVALGADNPQTVKAFAEAEAWQGPSLIIAYSHCIAHGIEMAHGMSHQKEAVDTGYWPLYRYDPRLERPFQLDSRSPKLPVTEFTATENRFAILGRTNPAEAQELAVEEQHDVDERWRLYEALAEGPGRV